MKVYNKPVRVKTTWAITHHDVIQVKSKMCAKTQWLHQLLFLCSFSGADSLPISQVWAIHKKHSINCYQENYPAINTSQGEGHHVLGRQRRPPHMVMNCRVITRRQVVRDKVSPRTLGCPTESVHVSRSSRLGSRTSCIPAQGDSSQSTVHSVMVLTGRTGLLIAMGEVSYPFIQDRTPWRPHTV